MMKRSKFRLAFVLFSFQIFFHQAWAENVCNDPWHVNPKLFSALDDLSKNQGSQLKLVDGAKELDHLELGPEGKEIVEQLDQLMVGHEEVKIDLARAIQRAILGTKSSGRPVGTFLLLGVTGTGKSLTGEALAEVLTGDRDAKIDIDGGEFQEDHEISKIVGAPPGYVGHQNTAPLITEESLKIVTSKKYNVNVVMVDEFEKASPALQRLLLGIMEKGKLRTGNGKVVSFYNTVLIFTSNLGQAEMQRLIQEHKTGLGFRSAQLDSEEGLRKLDERLDDAVMGVVKQKLAPEFVNRLDKIFIFKRHSTEESQRVLAMTLAAVQRKNFLAGEKTKVAFALAPDAANFLLEKKYQSEFGGRSLRKTVDHLIVEPLTNLLATRKIKNGDVVAISMNESGNDFVFKKVASDLSETDLKNLYQQTYGHKLDDKNIDAQADLKSFTTDPNRFSEFLDQVAATGEHRTQLNLIDDFIENAPAITDTHFLSLLKILPPEWDWGWKKSEPISDIMKKLNLGNWTPMAFEPVRLRFYWRGMERIQFLKVENRQLMKNSLSSMIYETSEYLKTQGLKPEYLSDILKLLQVLHSKVMSLPPPPNH